MGFLTRDWKPLATPGVTDYPYEVSDWGEVRRAGSSELLKPWLSGGENKYPKVSLYGPRGRRVHYVHHLVAHAHVGPQPAGTEVHHIDGDTFNADRANLEYVTPRVNARSRFLFGGADE